MKAEGRNYAWPELILQLTLRASVIIHYSLFVIHYSYSQYSLFPASFQPPPPPEFREIFTKKVPELLTKLNFLL